MIRIYTSLLEPAQIFEFFIKAEKEQELLEKIRQLIEEGRYGEEWGDGDFS